MVGSRLPGLRCVGFKDGISRHSHNRPPGEYKSDYHWIIHNFKASNVGQTILVTTRNFTVAFFPKRLRTLGVQWRQGVGMKKFVFFIDLLI